MMQFLFATAAASAFLVTKSETRLRTHAMRFTQHAAPFTVNHVENAYVNLGSRSARGETTRSIDSNVALGTFE